MPHRGMFNPAMGIWSDMRVSLMRRRKRYVLEAELVPVSRSNSWEQPIAGINAFDLASPDMRENIARFCDSLLSQPCAAIVCQSAQTGPNRSPDIQTLYMPLLAADNSPSIILGLTSCPTPGLKPSLKNQIAVAHSQFSGLSFIDLGFGTPDIVFDAARSGPSAADRRTWWQRFLPRGSKSGAATSAPMIGPAVTSYRPNVHVFEGPSTGVSAIKGSHLHLDD